MLARRRRPVTVVTTARMALYAALAAGWASGGVGAIGQRGAGRPLVATGRRRRRVRSAAGRPCGAVRALPLRQLGARPGRAPRHARRLRPARGRLRTGVGRRADRHRDVRRDGRARNRLAHAAPFSVAALWWERRHGVSEMGYLEAIFGGWLALGGTFVAVCIALLVVMALARWVGSWWWIPGAGVFALIAALFVFTGPYLTPGLERPDDPQLIRTYERFERTQGVDVPLRVEEVSGDTSQANAYAFGIGPSSRIVLWDTLLDGRFSDGEVGVVLAHELAHHSSDHIPEAIGWFALFALPGALVLVLATRRRGGMGEPAAVPIALLVVAVLQLALAPPRTSSVVPSSARPTGRRCRRPATRTRRAGSSASSRTPRSATRARPRGLTCSCRRTPRSPSAWRWRTPGPPGSAESPKTALCQARSHVRGGAWPSRPACAYPDHGNMPFRRRLDRVRG